MRLCTCQWNAVRLNHAPTGLPMKRTPRTWRRVRPSTRMPSTSTRQSPQEIVRQSAAGPSSSSFTTNSCGRGPSAAAKKEADPCATRESRTWSTIPTPRRPLRGVGGMAGMLSDLPPVPSRQCDADSKARCRLKSAHACAVCALSVRTHSRNNGITGTQVAPSERVPGAAALHVRVCVLRVWPRRDGAARLAWRAASALGHADLCSDVHLVDPLDLRFCPL